MKLLIIVYVITSLTHGDHIMWVIFEKAVWHTPIMLRYSESVIAFVSFPEELHAEVCYAECLLQRAALTFLQVCPRGGFPFTANIKSALPCYYVCE